MGSNVPFIESEGFVVADGQFSKRFKVTKKVGYQDSEVYFCEDKERHNELVVLKVEQLGKRKKSRLEVELNHYKRLCSSPEFNNVLDFFYGHNHRFLVMKKRGIDLKVFYRKQCKANNWSESELNTYAVQMIQWLQKFHSKGKIHLDPKLNNFVLDENDSKKIHLIDFDCAKDYIDANGQHIPYRTKLDMSDLNGNRHYLSLNGHNGEEQSRRDDMIFLGYVLIWMARGGLPWSRARLSRFESRQEYYEYLKKEKMSHTFDQLCDGFPNLIQYMKYCSELEFEDSPDYTFLSSLFLSHNNSNE